MRYSLHVSLLVCGTQASRWDISTASFQPSYSGHASLTGASVMMGVIISAAVVSTGKLTVRTNTFLT